MHDVVDEHDTPVRRPFCAAGIDCIVQLTPFQRSANMASVPELAVE